MSGRYDGYDLPTLHAALSGADQDYILQHMQELKRQQSAVVEQRGRLLFLRETLAQHWPPEKSEAAAAFYDRMTGLIDSMNEAARGAGQLVVTLEQARSTLFRARNQLDQLMNGYSESFSTETRYNKDLVARQVYEEMDKEMVAVRSLAPDLPPGGWKQGPSAKLRTDSSMADLPAGGFSGSSSGFGIGSSVVSPPNFDPPPVPAPIDAGPVLAGSSPQTSIPGLGSLPDGGPGGSPGAGVGSIDVPGVMPPRIGGSPGRVVGSPEGIRVNGLIGGRGGALPSTPLTTPTGGPSVIGGRGGSAGRGVTMPGSIGGGRQSGPAGRKGAVAHPGAVSDHSSASGARRIGHEGSTPGGGWRDRSYEHYTTRRNEPGEGDDQWEVLEGETPLIDAPKRRPHHDPGPGVIGIDR